MIVVTGGAGFIGSNLVAALNERGRDDIIVVDDLEDGTKFINIGRARIADYLDKDQFLDQIETGVMDGHISAIVHLGAISATTEWDGLLVMNTNYEYSKSLFHFCQQQQIPFIYASSASVYGAGTTFVEDFAHEGPINMYAYSKFQFDQYVRRHWNELTGQVVGLRYFNVYGPREQHKGTMASVAYHFNNQIKDTGVCRLFEGTEGYADGGQLRDFVYVGDVVDTKLWLLDNPSVSGIFNLGTGKAHSFLDVANAVIGWHGRGKVEFIPFPDHLKGRYQSFTQADISALRAAGYAQAFDNVEQGVKKYLDWLNG